MSSRFLLSFILNLGCMIMVIVGLGQSLSPAPALLLDFGTSKQSTILNAGELPNYRKTGSFCPDDGYYAITNYTRNCFEGRWHTLLQDHTEGDMDGNMMVVNASESPGSFFLYDLEKLEENSTYEISLWLVNICLSATGCTPTPPNILIRVERENGTLIQNMQTGNIVATPAPRWRYFKGRFTLPSGVNRVRIRIDNVSSGGCGNDFALDDVMVLAVNIPENKPGPAEVKKELPSEKSKPVLQKRPVPVSTEVPPSTAAEKTRIQPPAPVPFERERDPDIGIKKELPVPVPEPLLLRANPLVKRIEVPVSEIIVELYDNGEVDGDTISVFHNNRTVIAQALLSAKPLRFTIKINQQEPHHEIVMVAHNLGSIPPNTSLMIITAGSKRYTVSISSNEQKNAKVVFDLKE